MGYFFVGASRARLTVECICLDLRFVICSVAGDASIFRFVTIGLSTIM